MSHLAGACLGKRDLQTICVSLSLSLAPTGNDFRPPALPLQLPGIVSVMISVMVAFVLQGPMLYRCSQDHLAHLLVLSRFSVSTDRHKFHKLAH